jgi:hypothetical protein
MRKILLALVPAAGLLAAPTIAAADGTAGGAAAGAIGGAIIAGPIGAVAGLFIGGVVGTVIDPPPRAVAQYVAVQDVPSVRLEGRLVVGAQLPRQVTLYPVPADPTYAYAFINGHRVIVDPQTYVVVEIVS